MFIALCIEREREVHVLRTYKSPLTYDRVVLVEMFESNLYNAHIVWSQPIHYFVYQL